jgi:hypothetical protein
VGSYFTLSAQPVDATQALNSGAGLSDGGFIFRAISHNGPASACKIYFLLFVARKLQQQRGLDVDKLRRRDLDHLGAVSGCTFAAW